MSWSEAGTEWYHDQTQEESEPPLLEELGVDTELIVHKALTVLRFGGGSRDQLAEVARTAELAGPLAFCLVLAACLLVGGGGAAARLNAVYGLVLMGCCGMYALLRLMGSSAPPLTAVVSALGYCLPPLILLCGLGAALPLHGPAGVVLAPLTVAWSSWAAARQLAAIASDPGQTALFAYPCAILYGVFVLIAVF